MKSVRRSALAALRLVFGAVVVLWLLRHIDHSTRRVVFSTRGARCEAGSVYCSAAAPNARFLIEETADGADSVIAVGSASTRHPVPSAGRLARVSGNGQESIDWHAATCRPYGLRRVGHAILEVGRRWPYPLAATALFFLAIALCAARWKVILDAHGLGQDWRRTGAIFLIGHFFNAFMFGVTGGDLVKAVYAAKETGHRKTQAVSTVLIDRTIGLAVALLLTSGIMLARPRLFLGCRETRYAFAMILSVTVAAGLVLWILAHARQLLPRHPGLRRWIETRPGRVLLRVYETFHGSLTHPRVVALTVLLSLANQVVAAAVVSLLGRGMGLPLAFGDYFLVVPAICTIGALPLTPGGLGIREYAAVLYFGLLGVPPSHGMALGLLVYLVSVVWSAFGGIVFLVHGHALGHTLRGDLAEASMAE